MGGKVASSLAGVRDSGFGSGYQARHASKAGDGAIPNINPESRLFYTLRVATAGGTRDARSAGPSTAS